MADLTKWKLVPVEPTIQMDKAMWCAMFQEPYDGTGAPMLYAGYQAMLAAAPAPPAPEATVDTTRLSAEDRRMLERALLASTEVLCSLPASPAPSLPTREEIAGVVYEATCESYSAKPYWPDEPSEIKALHRRQADRILALFARPQENKP